MTNKNLELLEKLFESQLLPMKEDVRCIKEAIYGNGKVGLLDRVSRVENTQKNLLGKFATMTVFFGMVITAVFELAKEFITRRF
jgi:hypothetical protein